MRLAVITGQSGAGKSIALNTLEDLGWYCIDNLPAGLLEVTVRHLQNMADDDHIGTAVAIDARTPGAELATAVATIPLLREDAIDVSVIYLQADADTLLKRFSETRRRHPLSSSSVSLREAIGRETDMLASFALLADLRVDTTHLSIYDLRDQLRNRLASATSTGLSVMLQSFGFKHGVPADADYVFDVRCLPNPYWVPELRDFTGHDTPVMEFLSAQPSVQTMVESIRDFLRTWLPAFETGARSYLTVAVGCTGGRHRSVYVIERLHEAFAESEHQIQVRHRELT